MAYYQGAHYDLILHSAGPLRVQCVRILHDEIKDFNLQTAMEFVRNKLPGVIVANAERKDIRSLRERLIAIGADARIQRIDAKPRAQHVTYAPNTDCVTGVHMEIRNESSGTHLEPFQHSLTCEVKTRLHEGHADCACACGHKGIA